MDTATINATEFLVKQFNALERTEVKIAGLGDYFAKPMTLTQRIKAQAIFKEEDSDKRSKLMAKTIVDRVIDNNGEKVFLNFDNSLAHVALAERCEGRVIEDLFITVLGKSDDDAEIEEVVGKSSEPDTDS